MSNRTEILAFNERVKLFASFLKALGLGLIGFAILRPITESLTGTGYVALSWGALGLVLHALAHYVLGYLKLEGPP